MNAYPPDLLSHHYPLLILSGIIPPPLNNSGQHDGGQGASTSAAATGPGSLVAPTTAYPQLCADLRALVATRGRDTPWDPARAKSTAFKTLLVENVSMPFMALLRDRDDLADLGGHCRTTACQLAKVGRYRGD